VLLGGGARGNFILGRNGAKFISGTCGNFIKGAALCVFSLAGGGVSCFFHFFVETLELWLNVLRDWMQKIGL
jgi:hypothetical protein